MERILLEYVQPYSSYDNGMCCLKVIYGGGEFLIPTYVRLHAGEWNEVKEMVGNAVLSESCTDGLYMAARQLVSCVRLAREAVADSAGRCLPLYDVRRRVMRYLFSHDFFYLVEHRIDHLRRSGQTNTAGNYSCALRLFRMFWQKTCIAAGELNSNVMTDFQKYMIGMHLSMNTVSLYNRSLRAVYNFALEEGLLFSGRQPFRKVFTGMERTRKRAVRRDVVRKIIACGAELGEGMSLSRDLFLFSVYTQGMPFVDLAHLTVENLYGGRISYRRRKTNRHVEVSLPQCALEIIEKYHEKDSRYLFPVLYDSRRNRTVNYNTALRMHNKRLHALSELLHLDTPLSSYVARHTWASIAKWNGVEGAVISEAMGHSSIVTTNIYLASLDDDVIAQANEVVIHSILKE